MSCNFLTSLVLDHVNQTHDLVVMQLSKCFSIDLQVRLLTECPIDFIVVLILENGHLGVDDVADQAELLVPLDEQIVGLVLRIDLLLLFGLGLLDQLLAFVLSLRLLFPISNLFIYLVELHLDGLHLVVEFPPLLVQINDFVH